MTINTTTKGALMDSGANGSMAGSDMRILNYYAQDRAHVTGIAGNTLLDLPIFLSRNARIGGICQSPVLRSIQ